MPRSKEFESLSSFSSGNPYLNFMGIQLIDAGEGWVRMHLPFRQEFLQPSTIHGGAIYSLADSAATHSLLTLTYPKEWGTTVEQRINFLRAPGRQDLHCEAWVVHLGKTLAYTEVSITTPDGKLVARSTATQMRLDPGRWAEGRK